jgi:hypothetical protein
MTVTTEGRPSRRRVVRSAVALMLAAAPFTGCAVAARLATTAEAVSTIRDVLGTGRESPESAPTAAVDVHAVVDHTHGSGLRLDARPGSGRITVLADGSVVTVLCSTTGPGVDGSRGTTVQWSFVRTGDGHEGYMSEAFLVLDADRSAVRSC